ncbi:MAG: 50S ribosomal protein L18 [Dehalococcoidia bacterium]|nr:50S ribosomal protein L18 [Dehalococcoidia bacterium]MDZ4246288.1 50S ribosomal protein L18 [Dehalococcoidia bacterium]
MKIPRKKEDSRSARAARHHRIRTRVQGTAERPRLCVFRSLNHVYGQIIDDVKGATLISASTLDTELREKVNDMPKKDIANLVGKLVGQRALEKGITTIIFDRAGYKYHGRVKSLAEGAREAGLQF